MSDGYDSDTSGCSSSSEDLIALASAVAAASRRSRPYCTPTLLPDRIQTECIAERAVGRRLLGLGTGSYAA
jgi:hypothetical protein